MGAVIAAAAGAADRRLVRRLRDAGATSPATAAQLAPLRGMEGRRLAGLEKRGVVRRVGADRFYLDEAAHSAWVAERQRRVGVVLLLALVVLLVLAWQLARTPR